MPPRAKRTSPGLVSRQDRQSRRPHPSIDSASPAVVKLNSESLERAQQLIKLHNLKRRSRVTSIAMLCLFAHALFVSVTHHHSSRQDVSAPDARVAVENSDGSGETPGSTSDAHCLACRLQRNFNSNAHTSSVPFQLVDEPLTRETPSFWAGFTGSALLLFGRAPPLI